jgi:signal transduction histidine kinase
LPKVFEPYFSTKQAGFGLGLAVTKKIVEEHKGSIEVQSHVDRGTTFTLKLPAAPAESAEFKF